MNEDVYELTYELTVNCDADKIKQTALTIHKREHRAQSKAIP